MKNSVDYIIVGQGIAGSILGLQLIKKGYSILVIDQGYKNSSSYVAAGLINPTVLKRITKTWRAEEFIKYNNLFYKSLHEFLSGTYYYKTPFSKLINSTEEKDFWKHRFEQEGVSNYIEKKLKKVENSEQFNTPYLEGKVKNTAWLNIKPFLADFRKHILNKESLLKEKLDFKELKHYSKHIEYKGIKAKKILFCEGAKISENPFFNYIPMVLNKGELITIKTSSFRSNKILKKKVFVLPIDKETYKIGATFEWKWESEKPSEKKKSELETDFKNISSANYEIINHEAGVRPSSRDRRPVIGLHPDYKNFGVFNGLGSRGCLMAPLLSKEFVLFLEEKKIVRNEADVKRFEKFRPNSNA